MGAHTCPKATRKHNILEFRGCANLAASVLYLLLWMPLCSRSVNRGSHKSQDFDYKSGWKNHTDML